MSIHQAELQELEATEQHLKRQQASLTDRLSRLEHQSSLKREAAASAVEEQLKEKEAIEAENAAARAKIAENEALVRLCSACANTTCQYHWAAVLSDSPIKRDITVPSWAFVTCCRLSQHSTA